MDLGFLFLFKVLIYALLTIILLFLYFLESWPTPRRFFMVQKLPGPKGVFFLGNAFELKNVPLEDLINWLEEKFEHYQRLMRMWILGISYVFLRQPDDVQVLLNSKQHITKGYEYHYFKDWLEEGLLTSTGDKWFRRRKLLTPAFHFKILEDNLTVFNKDASIFVEKLKQMKGEAINIDSLVTLCTLDVIVSTAMGIDINAQNKSSQDYVKEIKRVSELLAYRVKSPHLYKNWMFSLSSTGRKFWKCLKFLHNYSYKVINERKTKFLENNDVTEKTKFLPEGGKIRRALLDTLLQIEKDRPGTFSDRDMREEVDTFMFEGHDTTSAALTFIFFNLAAHMEIQEKAYEELADIFGDDERNATVDDLHRMNYLEKVIKESLRLYPSVPYMSRSLEKDLVLDDGLTIPAPSNVIVPVYIVHRNEKYWPEPEKFDPERFSEENIVSRHPYAYIPFSAGPRNCIGQKFAMMELKVVTSAVLRKLKVLPITKREDFKFCLHLILRTNKSIKCKFVPR